MTRKSCAVGMHNAILRNYLNAKDVTSVVFVYSMRKTGETGSQGSGLFQDILCVKRKNSTDKFTDSLIISDQIDIAASSSHNSPSP